MNSAMIVKTLNGMDRKVVAEVDNDGEVKGLCKEEIWHKVQSMFPRARSLAIRMNRDGALVHFTIPDGAVYIADKFNPPVSPADKPRPISPMEEAIYSPESQITIAIHQGDKGDILFFKGLCPGHPKDAEWYPIFA